MLFTLRFLYYEIKLKNIEKNKNHAMPSLVGFERYKQTYSKKNYSYMELRWRAFFFKYDKDS